MKSLWIVVLLCVGANATELRAATWGMFDEVKFTNNNAGEFQLVGWTVGISGDLRLLARGKTMVRGVRMWWMQSPVKKLP
jgi:hypothetical protein